VGAVVVADALPVLSVVARVVAPFSVKVIWRLLIALPLDVLSVAVSEIDAFAVRRGLQPGWGPALKTTRRGLEDPRS
jgi:hypothetical protein